MDIHWSARLGHWEHITRIAARDLREWRGMLVSLHLTLSLSPLIALPGED
ncbi:MAG: hypothetical protein JJE16_16690 [Nitrospiraceae bacterium]|nr:hypothetical protein [Nitrospiraceae bacterium]